MRFSVLVTILAINLLFAETYNVGDSVSLEHQNIEMTICANDNRILSLADLNGSLNGGNYNVTWISFFTSW